MPGVDARSTYRILAIDTVPGFTGSLPEILPGAVNLCGLPPTVASWSLALIGLANILGSLIAGSCTQRFRSKYILAVMYGSRALLIGWYLVSPKTKWRFYGFTVGLGLTWLAKVPPTATIVGKLFGSRYLSTGGRRGGHQFTDSRGPDCASSLACVNE